MLRIIKKDQGKEKGMEEGFGSDSDGVGQAKERESDSE